jgi:hypothetical protein
VEVVQEIEMLKEQCDAMEAMGRMMEVEDEPDEGRAAGGEGWLS